MKHTTDSQIADLLNLETSEKEFHEVVIHLGECQVCRERLFHEMKNPTGFQAMLRNLSKTVAGSMVEAAREKMDTNSRELIMKAVDAVTQLDPNTPVTGEAIGMKSLDEIDHFKECMLCQGRLHYLANMTREIKVEMAPDDPKRPALIRVQEFLQTRDDMVDVNKMMLTGVVSIRTDCPSKEEVRSTVHQMA